MEQKVIKVGKVEIGNKLRAGGFLFGRDRR